MPERTNLRSIKDTAQLQDREENAEWEWCNQSSSLTAIDLGWVGAPCAKGGRPVIGGRRIQGGKGRGSEWEVPKRVLPSSDWLFTLEFGNKNILKLSFSRSPQDLEFLRTYDDNSLKCEVFTVADISGSCRHRDQLEA